MKKDLEALTEIEKEAIVTTITLEIMMKSKEIMKKVNAFSARNMDISLEIVHKKIKMVIEMIEEEEIEAEIEIIIEQVDILKVDNSSKNPIKIIETEWFIYYKI